MSPLTPLRLLPLSLAVALAGGLALSGQVTLPVVAAGDPIAVTDPVATVLVQPAVVAHLPAPPLADPVLPPPAQVLRERIATGLDCALSASGVRLCLHGEDAPPGDPQRAGGSAGATPTEGAIGCYGNGMHGPRVRAVYARPQSAPDRFAASVGSIRSWAAGVSSQFDASAAQTGGRRHVRFATTSGSSCIVAVMSVALPDSAFGSFRATIDALQAQGLRAPYSKYLVWADVTGTCGLATTYDDSRPGAENLNNSELPSYARIDRGCWGKVETHELVHMLGGVQPSARNATAGFHCNDGLDVMCYDDGTSGGKQRSVCGKERVHLLDCRNDDYFSTAPARGSYLDLSWNVARSAFLAPALLD